MFSGIISGEIDGKLIVNLLTGDAHPINHKRRNRQIITWTSQEDEFQLVRLIEEAH